MTTSFITALMLGVAFMVLAQRGPWPGLRPYTHLGFLAPGVVALVPALWKLSQSDWLWFLVAAFCAVTLFVATWAVRILAGSRAQARTGVEGAQ